MTKDTEIEPDLRTRMNELARFLDRFFNGEAKGADRKLGFVLGVFQFGEEGRFNYISNADRGQVVVLLKEMVARFEGQPEVSGRA